MIYTEDAGQKFALKLTARDPANQEFEVFYLLNRAKIGLISKSPQTYGGATQNFVYADVSGNIGWTAAGTIPLRKKGDGAFPYDGSTDDGKWIGSIPFQDLPRLYNPAQGFIVTANQRIVGSDYKYTQMVRNFASPWRARRIFDQIHANSKITVSDVTDILRDDYSLPHTMLAREILKSRSASPETLKVLEAWNGKMQADSQGALLIDSIRNKIAEKIGASNKTVPVYYIREKILPIILAGKPVRWLPSEFKTYSELFQFADRSARESLQKQFGTDESTWIWGAIFKANFPHPLAAAPLIGGQFATPKVGINGSGVTPNVGSSVSMRHISTPVNWDNTRFVIPLGESGDPKSPFYRNQFDSWNQGELPVFPFSKTAVTQAAVTKITLLPN